MTELASNLAANNPLAGKTEAELIAKFMESKNYKAARAAAHKEEIATIDGFMSKLENELLRRANESGLKSFKCAAGTATVREDTHYNISDGAAFSDFVVGLADCTFFQSRVSSTRIKEYIKELESSGAPAVLPPGIASYTELKIAVTKA